MLRDSMFISTYHPTLRFNYWFSDILIIGFLVNIAFASLINDTALQKYTDQSER